jgi:magnesium-transporting ATPase (P-type)
LEEFKNLFLLLKEYIQKQKENITLGAAESMTRVFFAATMGFIILMLSSIILLLACFALAFWLNEVTKSSVYGFLILAGAILLITIILWIGRRKWVLQPIAKLMVRIFLDAEQAEDNNTNPQK